MKEFLKRRLPSSAQRQLRQLGRLRWANKLGILRTFRFPIFARPMIAARYVFADPEVESFTYEIENQGELAEFISGFVNEPVARVVSLIEEANTDPILTRDRGFSLSVKRRPPLGTRLIWYVVARLMKPAVVVETGIHQGLGSEVLLRALQRNTEEGHPGRLISFDVFEDTGWLVSDSLRGLWTRVIGSTFTALKPALQGLEVGLLSRDTPPTEECARFELTTVLRHAAPRLAVIDSAGEQVPVLRELCAERGVPYQTFGEVPHEHFLPTCFNGYGLFERGKSAPIETPAVPVNPR